MNGPHESRIATNLLRQEIARILRISPFAVAALLAPGLAAAQAAPNEPIDEVVVTGLRQSIQTSQEIKQNAEVIVDSISAVDISALPDRSVTEALQRISGVAIDHLFAPSDTNRFSAEGSGVTIRGLSQVRSELNGRDVFSARNTRGLSFEDVPAELMSGVDVFKNPSADMVEGGIAGTVNLRTRKPLDHEGFTGGVTGSANFGDFSEEMKPQASLLLSNSWETDHGTFGALIDVAYSELATRTDSIQFGRPFRRNAADVGATGVPCENATTGAAMSCVFVPAGARWSELDFNRKRKGVDIALQWQPNDQTNLWLNVLRSDYQMNWIEHSAWLEDSAYSIVPAAGTSFTFDENGVFQSGMLTSNGWIPGNDYLGQLQTSGARMPTGSTARAAEQHQKTTDYAFTAEVDVTERLSFSGDVQYVEATADNYDYTLNTQVNPSALAVDLTGKLPSVSANPGGYLEERDNFFWAAGMDDTQQNEATQLATRLSLSFALDSGWLQTLKAGVRYTDRKATNRDTGYNWQPISQWWQSDAQGNWPGHLASMDSYLTDDSVLFNFSDFFRGKANLPGGLWVASDSLVQNLKGNAGLVQTALVNGSGWAPDSFRDGDTNTQQENTYAAFGLLRFAGEVGSKTLDGNIGVRVVQTDYEAWGSAKQPDWTAHPLLNNNGDPDFVAKWGSGAWLPNHLEESYQDVLPSLNLRLKLLPELQLRFAASKAVARPSLDQITANVDLSGDIKTTYLPDPDANGNQVPAAEIITSFKGSGGNPLLKPMEAMQYDAAVEWYFAPQGSLYTTLFYKDLKNYFLRGTQAQDLFGRDDWQFTTTVNGDKGVVKGFEVGYSQFYDELPNWLRGLGMQANFTFVDSKGGSPTAGASGDAATVPPGLPLEGLSKKSYNVVGLYQRGPVEARLAYNWRERWLLTTHDGDGKGSVWNEDYGQLDASVFVRFSEHLQVGLEGNNLTNTTQKLLVGPYKYSLAADSATPAYNVNYTDSRLYQNAWFTFDRRFALTARWTF